MGYVALSRVRSIEGLYIRSPFFFNGWWQPAEKVNEFNDQAIAAAKITLAYIKGYKPSSFF
jgi:hypothetical protein